MTLEKEQNTEPAKTKSGSFWTPWASVKLTVLLLSLIALTVLIGAWCPQESQVGIQKVIEQFGEETALLFSKIGITDIFHSTWFLSLIGFLTINMIACSMQRVFPKVRSFKQELPYLKADAIPKLAASEKIILNVHPETALHRLTEKLKRKGYSVKKEGTSLKAEFGKVGRLAPTVTHIGLLSLLLGVTITSWTGFTGFQPVPVSSIMNFESSEHSKLWVGKLPSWSVKAEKSWREDYPSGDVKQWYTDLAVVDKQGKVLKRQQISVNNPLTFENVDIYQSSWGLDRIVLTFNDTTRVLNLRPMGKLYAAFLPLDEKTILLFSVRDQIKPLRVFAKADGWAGPKLLAEVPLNGTAKLGGVELGYRKVFAITGLQYKCDPGLPITYVAFGFIIAGVLLAAIPHRQLWASAVGVNEGCELSIGGHSMKAKQAFAKSLHLVVQNLGNTVHPEPALESQAGKVTSEEKVNV
jgi:cytochrome c biogenesis protein